MRKRYFSIVCLCFITFSGCQKTGFLTKYGIFNVSKSDSTTAIMNGTIGGNTDRHFDKLIADYPNLKTIRLEDCPGSRNDEVNLRVAKKIHDMGMHTDLKKNAEIASGAVDLFLAGTVRTIESGAKIGVHSWNDGKNEGGDLPENHSDHNLYINYYTSIGMTEQEAKKFYFFTITSAKANSIHWMTEQEIVEYNMVKP